jgi:hypothetical protein
LEVEEWTKGEIGEMISVGHGYGFGSGHDNPDPDPENPKPKPRVHGLPTGYPN